MPASPKRAHPYNAVLQYVRLAPMQNIFMKRRLRTLRHPTRHDQQHMH
jgi:hypothetical protein